MKPNFDLLIEYEKENDHNYIRQEYIPIFKQWWKEPQFEKLKLKYKKSKKELLVEELIKKLSK